MEVYRVVTARSEEELSKKVSALMKEGWKCLGGMVSYMELHRIYAQTMVKEEKQPASSRKKASDKE